MKYSIIIPAYNEELRIERFLTDLIEFLDDDSDNNPEIIVVNDGSTDATLDVVNKFKEKVRVISYEKNRGKGFAVKTGILAANGDKLIFIDADGAISPQEIPEMLRVLDTYDIGIGTRIAKESRIINSQPIYRVFMGKIFNHIVNLIFHLDVYDTLCGFKGFRREVGKELAHSLKSTGWEFDVELLYRAKKKGYHIVKVPITWSDVKGSKLSISKDPFHLLTRIIKIKSDIDHE